MFKIGDKVWDVRFGWGSVFEIAANSSYPVCVRFNDHKNPAGYTRDGRYSTEDPNRALFFSEIKIPKEAFERPRPDLKIDDRVIVWNDTDQEMQHRHFAGWYDDGRIQCWTRGRTSWSADSDQQWHVWNNYKLPEDADEQGKNSVEPAD